jgi:hypothetical protein
LYRRLETLAETEGRFGLNVALPIAFDGASRLEVDLLCADCRVAVELDGAKHFTEEGAKHDAVRDEYLRGQDIRVLRFENKAVYENLEFVLETIKGALGLTTPPSPSLIEITRLGHPSCIRRGNAPLFLSSLVPQLPCSPIDLKHPFQL